MPDASLEDAWALFSDDEDDKDAFPPAACPTHAASDAALEQNGGDPRPDERLTVRDPPAAAHPQLSWVREFWPAASSTSDELVLRAETHLLDDLLIRGPGAISSLRRIPASADLCRSVAAVAAGLEELFCQLRGAERCVSLESARWSNLEGLCALCDGENDELAETLVTVRCWCLGVQLLEATRLGYPENGDETCPMLASRDPDTATGIWLKLFETVVYGEGLGLVPGAAGWVAPCLLGAEKAASASWVKRFRGGNVPLPVGRAPCSTLPSEAIVPELLRIPDTIPTSEAVAVVPKVDPARKIETYTHDLSGDDTTMSPLRFARDYRMTPTRPGRPVVIRNYLLSGSAPWDFSRLADLANLLENYGDRLVPVSLGSLLNLPGAAPFSTGIMPLGELILNHLVPSNATHTLTMTEEVMPRCSPSPQARGPGTLPDTSAPEPFPTAEAPDMERVLPHTAYMAQHQLFHQVPELLDHFSVPAYNLGRRLQAPNLWIGTRGTMTTLHSDTSDGFLCQVAGYKYVRLYGALNEQQEKLYATFHAEADGATMWGTSPVRVEVPDFDEHPLFEGATYTEAILEPGDMLYIPQGHWHYVRGLTTSVSVNFW